MIKGNTNGIKEYMLNELEEIHDIKTEKGSLANIDIINKIVEVTSKINREICVAINRKGSVIGISIGDSNTASLPIIDTSKSKLSGVRIIHTHPNSSAKLSNVDISALQAMRLDVISAIGITDDKITGVSLGFCKFIDGELSYEESPILTIDEIESMDLSGKYEKIEKEFRENEIKEDNLERAIIVGIDTEESLNELKELADACDIKVIEKVLQKKNQVDNAYFIGSGKVRELNLLKQVKNANLIIFDEELTGIQSKNLVDSLGCRVIDRTMLILEIFSRRAKTKEAKIQVELAQLKYKSSRLLGYGITLSRQGGSGNTRGAGEQKLELDKRRIKETIHLLKQELEKIQKSKHTQKTRRNKSGIPKLSLVGYTNVGKSTLRNILVDLYSDDKSIQKDHVLSKDMLFATLDTTVRTFLLPDKRVASLTDTVGFIRKLPHDLVESFKSTLDEVIYSDLILHVIDAYSETALIQIEAVENILEELKCMDKPMFLVLNKCDVATQDQIDKIRKAYSNYKTVEISAFKNINIDKLLDMTIEFLPREEKIVTFLIPYDESSIISQLHKNCVVEKIEYVDVGAKLTVSSSIKIIEKYEKYVL